MTIQQTQATTPEQAAPQRLYKFSLYADWQCVFSVERAVSSKAAAEQLLQDFAVDYNRKTNLFVIGNLEDITNTIFND